MRDQIGTATRWMLIALAAHSAASLLHYGHNAALLDVYPNMPRWLSRSHVFYGWASVTTIGVLGYALTRSRFQLLGLGVLAIYGLLGLDGLSHYALAPLPQHSLGMNVTILLEASTALLFLGTIAGVVRKRSASG